MVSKNNYAPIGKNHTILVSKNYHSDSVQNWEMRFSSSRYRGTHSLLTQITIGTDFTLNKLWKTFTF